MLAHSLNESVVAATSDDTSDFESAMSESDGDSLLPELRDTFSIAGGDSESNSNSLS